NELSTRFRHIMLRSSSYVSPNISHTSILLHCYLVFPLHSSHCSTALRESRSIQSIGRSCALCGSSPRCSVRLPPFSLHQACAPLGQSRRQLDRQRLQDVAI